MEYNVSDMRASDGSIIKFECHKVLPSTSRLAKDYAKRGYPDRYVVFAESKSKDEKDKGGMLKEADRGIFMSCILRPSIFPSQASLISSLAAVSLASALEAHTTKPIGIGWVSKIYCDGKMIGDIKIEGLLDDFKSYEYLVITYSVSLSEDNFPPILSDLVKKVFEEKNYSIPFIIAKDVLNNFFKYYVSVKKSTKFMTLYSQKFILRGKKIHYIDGGKKRVGRVLGIDMKNASLMIEDRKKQIVYLKTPNCVILPKKISIKEQRE
jgi:BirA family biotin operon repressor/biotin-[acetyl-CoA-carboxylase] ligase